MMEISNKNKYSKFLSGFPESWQAFGSISFANAGLFADLSNLYEKEREVVEPTFKTLLQSFLIKNDYNNDTPNGELSRKIAEFSIKVGVLAKVNFMLEDPFKINCINNNFLLTGIALGFLKETNKEYTEEKQTVNYILKKVYNLLRKEVLDQIFEKKRKNIYFFTREKIMIINNIY